jgi:hypothetical protein
VSNHFLPVAEPDGVSPEGVFAAGALLIFAMGIMLWLSWILEGPRARGTRTEILPRPEDSTWVARAGVTSGFPMLQTDPAADLAGFRAREDSVLRGYGWVDRAAGKVRVPVERAMELWLKQNGGRP